LSINSFSPWVYIHTVSTSAEVQNRNQSGYLPFNEKTNACLIIEDNVLSNEVCEEALRHGVRVRHIKGMMHVPYE